ncbi:ribonuclease P protein component [Methylobacterium goesingense]|uniref:Ribonuclease P protein component n=1 Tax=Methylobacterium goesingense TaxID=243690 RepID=A0ABV2L5C9_9HYPH|nr:ribonuclease P protein component [Methylobacterium goesingense]
MSTIGRLTRRSDFLAAAGGRRYHNERLSAQGLVRAEPAAGDDAPEGLRIGFTITKRVGHATERNRIRRRLRAAVAEAAGVLPARDADVVLVARRPALHAPFQTLIEDLRQAVAVVTKPQAAKTGAGSGHRAESGQVSSRRRRGKGAPASGASATAPVLATGATASASPGSRPDRAGAPSSPSNACDGPTDG